MTYWGHRRFGPESWCYKIGMTRKEPRIRLREIQEVRYAGHSDWKLLHHRKVSDPELVEEYLHRFCINSFYHVSPDRYGFMKDGRGQRSTEIFIAPLPAIKRYLNKLADGQFYEPPPPVITADTRQRLASLDAHDDDFDRKTLSRFTFWKRLWLVFRLAILAGAVALGFMLIQNSDKEEQKPSVSQSPKSRQFDTEQPSAGAKDRSKPLCRVRPMETPAGKRSVLLCPKADGSWQIMGEIRE